MIITEPDLVQEFVKRILPGVLRAVKQLSPTEVLDDGKRGHVGVRICDGVIYVEQGASACYCQAEVYPAEFAKKKSPLREMLAEERLSAVVNYASATKWLQMAGKSVIEVEIVPGGGLRLMVIPGVMEHSRCLHDNRRWT